MAQFWQLGEYLRTTLSSHCLWFLGFLAGCEAYVCELKCRLHILLVSRIHFKENCITLSRLRGRCADVQS